MEEITGGHRYMGKVNSRGCEPDLYSNRYIQSDPESRRDCIAGGCRSVCFCIFKGWKPYASKTDQFMWN